MTSSFPTVPSELTGVVALTQRAVELVQSSRQQLVTGLHRAPTHIPDVKAELRPLPRPANLLELAAELIPIAPSPSGRKQSSGLCTFQDGHDEDLDVSGSLLPKKPAHMLDATSCWSLVMQAVAPGIAAHTSGGTGGGLQLTRGGNMGSFACHAWDGRAAVAELRSAQSVAKVGRKQAAMHRAALHDVLSSPRGRRQSYDS
jgi:hypothetical protein